MAEIDFDELDNAVASLMNDATAAQQAKLTKTVDNTAQSPPVRDTVTSEPVVDLSKNDTPVVRRQPEQSPSIATRRRGQFMDVMHPSADMLKASSEPAARPATSRHNNVLQPSAAFTRAAETAAPVTPPSLATPEPPKQESVQSDDTWPDPIDLATSSSQAQSAKSDLPAALPDGLILGEKALPSGENTENPPISPFLADAKVEKRPLGSPAPEFSPEIELPSTEDFYQNEMSAPSEHSADTDEPVDTPMPAELSKDVMSVESGEALAHTPAPAAPVQPIVETDSSAPTGPSSIPPQYKTSTMPQSEEPETASMYATDHQELIDPVKKKSGWLAPTIVVLLIILGAVGGYVAYTFHIFG